MADRIFGYTPACTISNNGSGKVRVTFPAKTLVKRVYTRTAVDGSHYIGNTTRSATSAITAKGGSQSAGYWFDTALDFAGATWVTGDGCSPIRQSTLYAHATVAAFISAASSGDEGLAWYSNVALSTIWVEAISTSTAKGVSVTGMLPGRRITFASYAGGTFYYLRAGTNTAAKAVHYNFRLIGFQYAYRYYDDSAGNQCAGITIDAIDFIGCSSCATFGVAATAAKCTVQNCLSVGCQGANGAFDNLFFSGAGFTLINTKMLHGYYYGCRLSAGSVTVKNNVAIGNGTSDFRNIEGATVTASNNISGDATAPGASSLTNQTLAACAPEMQNANEFYPFDYRATLGASSILLGAGTDVGLTEDADGQAVSAPFPVGPSNGVAYIDRSTVLTTATPAGTYQPVAVTDVRAGTAVGVSPAVGTCAVPSASDVLLGVDVDDTVGTLSVSNIPDAPTVESVTAAGVSVTIAYTLTDETATCYLRYRSVGADALWSDEDATYSLEGSGSITVADLDIGTKYEFILYCKKSGLNSYWSKPAYAVGQTVGESGGNPFDVSSLALLASQVSDLWKIKGLDSTNPVSASGDGITSKTLTTDDITLTITDTGIMRA